MWEATTTFNLRLNRGERQKKDSKGKRERWRWIAWEWIHTSHFPCCQVVSSISELRYSNEHTILQSSASDLWIQFCHCSCWSFFFVVCFFGSHLSFRDFMSFSGFLDAQTPLLLLSFIALHGHPSCNYHILVDFVVNSTAYRLGKVCQFSFSALIFVFCHVTIF